MSTPTSYEQRRYPRVPLRYAIKLTTPGQGVRYVSAKTCNLSAGGAFVELDAAAGPFPIGTAVSIALPRSPHDVVLASSENLTGTVVRSEAGRRGVGVRFDRPVTLSIAAA